jgi:hypothetical protein
MKALVVFQGRIYLPLPLNNVFTPSTGAKELMGERIRNCDSMEILLAEVMDLSPLRNKKIHENFPFNIFFGIEAIRQKSTH